MLSCSLEMGSQLHLLVVYHNCRRGSLVRTQVGSEPGLRLC